MTPHAATGHQPVTVLWENVVFRGCYSSPDVRGGASGKESACQCRKPKRHRFDPWVRKIPWRRAQQPTPVLGFLLAQTVKNLPAMWETWVPSLGWKDLLEDGMATHFSILAWRIPMDRGAWRDTVHGVLESDTTERLRTPIVAQEDISHVVSHPHVQILLRPLTCSTFPVPLQWSP